MFENQIKGTTNGKKITLRGYYDALPLAEHPKTEFVNEVIRRTGVSSATVRNWIFYGIKPANNEHVKILSEITGIPQESLWAD